MEVQVQEDGSKAEAQGGFQKLYNELQTLIESAFRACEADDIKAVHTLHHKMLGKCIDLTQVSFFGLSVEEINQRAKAAREKPQA